ncbi:LysR family transcriptional regulator [Ramlibacter sp. AW1]|uniref:LysR family transcriptional regulator n=1 Tax=Ramlibacter aurantiacus TaxID=2801330 RepID=A0A936ZTT9_9BURK|nr:LysR family transcriptional regulator [Ramlibacter aurantiacus]MBL0423363.1 LysR family transcriptional regulator [Ramlibacter aurantiacus]
MDKYQEMRAFAAVVDAGSFVAAADAVGMSKAAVSRHVSELEQRLGSRLLHRTTRKLSLTAEGEVFLARCRDILASIDESEAEISTRSHTASGLLKVSVPVSFGIQHLAPLWSEFMQAHPRVSLDVQLADRIMDLVDEGFDLAVRIARLPDSSLVSRQLASTRLVLCASPRYLRARGTPGHPSELADHDVIGYSLFAMGDQWQFSGPGGPVTIKVRPRLWSNNGDTCVAACVRGAGIQLQPTFLVAPALASGQLVEVLPSYRPMELGIYAVYPTRKFVMPKVRALVEFLSVKLAQADWASGSTQNESAPRRRSLRTPTHHKELP